jgi:ATP-binding cassette subfamily F protein uup
VLLLDEPTNDLDIETLNVLEDFLDDWPGTLVVVSHDRYFLERVTDSIHALLDDGQISMLPGGVDEYLARRRAASNFRPDAPTGHELPPHEADPARADASAMPKARAGSADERAARKVLARVERQLEQVTAREAELNAEVLDHAADHERLTELSRALDQLASERESLEAEWLEAAEIAE